MNLIPSFQIDHTNLQPGIYKSRTDFVNNTPIVTYDIRMTNPNREPAIAPSAMHTIEHIAATYLRNNNYWKDRLIYWGPMGCLTGSYMITKGEYDCNEIKQIMIEVFAYIADYNSNEVPGATAANCGNYLLHDLPMAKWEAKRYVNRLMNDFHCEYQKIERKQSDGLTVYDA